jgi:peptidoglycan/LPS O-acetylase OafA/YrhL
LVFYYKLFPHWGDGPYYYASSGVLARNAECDDSWWANVLFINNLYPAQRGGLQGCMPWSWYLANDQQFFLLVPPLAFYFVRTRHWHALGSWTRVLVLFAPVFVLVLIQVFVTMWTMSAYDIKGSFDLNFNVHLYVKPWCRVSPYAVGMGLAMFHHDQAIINDDAGLPPKAWHRNLLGASFSGALPHLSALVALGVTSVIVFSLYTSYKCEAEKESDCHIWLAVALYGVLGKLNWPHAGLVAYYSLTYLAWSLAIAVLTMYAISGRGGLVTRFLAHPVFTPLARLTYNAYLVHIIWMIFTYSQNKVPFYVSTYHQVIDALAFVCLAYATSFVLYLWIEKPCMRFMPWLLCLDRAPQQLPPSAQQEQQHSLNRPSSVAPLERELSAVADVDSESLIMSSPERRRRAMPLPEQQVPLLGR